MRPVLFKVLERKELSLERQEPFQETRVAYAVAVILGRNEQARWFIELARDRRG